MGYALPNYLSFIMQGVDKVVFDCKIETDCFGIAGQRADVHVEIHSDIITACIKDNRNYYCGYSNDGDYENDKDFFYVLGS